MPVYEFSCPDDGRFDLTLAMTADTAQAACPTCAAPAGRVYSAPALRRGDPAARRLIEATRRTASEPGVVQSPPPRPGGRPVSTDPRTARLPRP
ncbi:MAG: FmdB family zinc ribbon protein [Actinomycetales bacterium]